MGGIYEPRGGQRGGERKPTHLLADGKGRRNTDAIPVFRPHAARVQLIEHGLLPRGFGTTI